MAKPTDVLLDHSVDGIREYDNPMPAWWLGILYVSIVFAVIYVPYLSLTDWSQVTQWEEEMAAAELAYAAPEPSGDAVAAAPIEGDIAEGAAIFAVKCVACHAADATGGIGPNLVDAEWIHGGSKPLIRKTIAEGVPEKGMLAWEPILGADQVSHLAAYVHNLGGGE